MNGLHDNQEQTFLYSNGKKEGCRVYVLHFFQDALYSAQIRSWDILQEKEQKRVTIIHILFIFFNPTSFLVGMKELKKPKHASN